MDDFDKAVAALRGSVPAKRVSRKKKADCTPEEWAGNLNYQAIVNAKYEASNYERRREMDRNRHWANLEKRRLCSRQSRQRHLEKRRAHDRERYANNPSKRIANSSRINRARRKSDPDFRLQCQLRTRLFMAVKGNYKLGSAVSDLGCSIDELWVHLESQFQPGMTRDNWGKAWVIDHIYPLAKVNVSDRAQLLAAVNWQNLQPLTPSQNSAKGDSVSPEAQALFDRLCVNGGE